MIQHLSKSKNLNPTTTRNYPNHYGALNENIAESRSCFPLLSTLKEDTNPSPPSPPVRGPPPFSLQGGSPPSLLLFSCSPSFLPHAFSNWFLLLFLLYLCFNVPFTFHLQPFTSLTFFFFSSSLMFCLLFLFCFHYFTYVPAFLFLFVLLLLIDLDLRSRYEI
ncbi:hypothetical protein PIB30_020954 [Stylosanthes scabra]|uniref:Uncharacterized protein n=1 Tax=Stylosanthes scabra TaxID=79078 RepID=A0ABU6R915_9FABA|nr:hypothetical protein [Stylosanthes scabra]